MQYLYTLGINGEKVGGFRTVDVRKFDENMSEVMSKTATIGCIDSFGLANRDDDLYIVGGRVNGFASKEVSKDFLPIFIFADTKIHSGYKNQHRWFTTRGT